jgi:hypothetical protein
MGRISIPMLGSPFKDSPGKIKIFHILAQTMGRHGGMCLLPSYVGEAQIGGSWFRPSGVRRGSVSKMLVRKAMAEWLK